MNRHEFIQIRDLPNKTIDEDIVFRKKSRNSFKARVAINNSLNVNLQLEITCNPRANSKTFNVITWIDGKFKPICRLDVDGHSHKEAGNSHKQFLLNENCPDNNLSEGYESHPELKGKTAKELFEYFCKIAKITHNGIIEKPEEMK